MAVEPTQVTNNPNIGDNNVQEEIDETLKQQVEKLIEKYGENVVIIDGSKLNGAGIITDSDGQVHAPGIIHQNSNSSANAIYIIEPTLEDTNPPPPPPPPDDPPPPPDDPPPPVDPIIIAANEMGRIVGDPHFYGFEGKGEYYDVMGKAGEIYNLISDKDVQVNGQFIGGAATLLGDVGIKAGNDKIKFNSDRTAPTINGKQLNIGETVKLDKCTVTWDGNSLTVTTNEYEIKVSQYTMEVKTGANGVFTDGVMPHGLLGQTADENDIAQHGQGNNGEGAIEGVYTDYKVGDLFSDDFKFNKYNSNKYALNIIEDEEN